VRRERAILTAVAGAAVLAAVAGCGETGEKLSPKRLWRRMTGPSAEEAVAMAFDPDDADRRRRGIEALSSRAYGLEEPYLSGYAELLKTDRNACVRSAAARALGKAGDARYLPALIAALEDAADVVRWDVAEALRSVHGPAAVAPLCKHARTDTSTDVRICCARALEHYRRNDVVAVLVECLEDPEFSVRYQAHESLVALTGQDHGYFAHDWRQAGALTAAPAARRRDRPWWDWLGITDRDDDGADEGPEAEPADDETGQAPAEAKRPWWDWFGLTDRDGKGAAESEPAGAAAGSAEGS